MQKILDKKKDETFSDLNKHMSTEIESAHWIPVKINEIQTNYNTTLNLQRTIIRRIS